MMVFQTEFKIKTSTHGELQDITEQVRACVRRSEVKAGLVHLWNLGSTAALGTIEFEPGLRGDLPRLLDRLIPPSSGTGHEASNHDGNGHSHLQATLLGCSLTVPVHEGELVLGRWQQIVHVECDVRPRTRTVVVTVMG